MTRPLRVLVWRQDLLPGSETFVRNQVEALQRHAGVEVVLAGVRRVSSPLASPQDSAIFEGGTLTRISQRRFMAGYSSPRFADLLKQFQPDLVHSHFVNESYPVMRALRGTRIPLVVTAHGYDLTKMPHLESDRRLYLRRLAAVTAGSARVFCVSQFMRDRARAVSSPSASLDVHYTGIPIPGGGRALDRRAGILFVGRLVEKKGVRDLIGLVSALRARGVSPPVTIVGDGPLKGELQRMAASVSELITFVGSASPSEVSKLMDEAAIFVAPSRTAEDGDSEGLGHVFLEAQAHRVPVVAYAHGGVPEAVVHGETGLLAAEGDEGALLNAVQQLLADEGERYEMATRARSHVLNRFDLVSQTAELVDRYRAVLRGEEPS